MIVLGYCRAGELPTICLHEKASGALADSTAIHEGIHADLFADTSVGRYLSMIEAVQRVGGDSLGVAAALELLMSSNLLMNSMQLVQEGVATFCQFVHISRKNGADAVDAAFDELPDDYQDGLQMVWDIVKAIDPAWHCPEMMLAAGLAVGKMALNTRLLEPGAYLPLPALIRSLEDGSNHADERLRQLFDRLDDDSAEEFRESLDAIHAHWHHNNPAEDTLDARYESRRGMTADIGKMLAGWLSPTMPVDPDAWDESCALRHVRDLRDDIGRRFSIEEAVAAIEVRPRSARDLGAIHAVVNDRTKPDVLEPDEVVEPAADTLRAWMDAANIADPNAELAAHLSRVDGKWSLTVYHLSLEGDHEIAVDYIHGDAWNSSDTDQLCGLVRGVTIAMFDGEYQRVPADLRPRVTAAAKRIVLFRAHPTIGIMEDYFLGSSGDERFIFVPTLVSRTLHAVVLFRPDSQPLLCLAPADLTDRLVERLQARGIRHVMEMHDRPLWRSLAAAIWVCSFGSLGRAVANSHAAPG